MIKIAQFGEGNFLRSFVDVYFNTLNNEGGNYSVDIIKPIEYGSLDNFHNQNNIYNVILRGSQKGECIETVCPISVVNSVISPFENTEMFYALAKDAELKIIISNTTEAGICFNPKDEINDSMNITFPAKLTKFLYERFKSGLDGVYILPVELIDNNANELYKCVNSYIELWNLPEEFKVFNDNQNYYCNTLVDRIVSGYPTDKETEEHLHSLIGYKDSLMSVAEPFGLWVIEEKGELATYIKSGKHNIDVVLADDISYYKKRKVRILNGSHTNLVAAGLMLGKETVYECMKDKTLYRFFENSLEEMIPYVSNDIDATKKFALDTEERFLNPFLNHKLSSIALNSISKWKARNLPTFKDYYKANNKIPYELTKGFAYLMYLYMTEYENLTDDAEYLEYFKNGGSVTGFMAKDDVWGEDLTKYCNFAEKVSEYISSIKSKEVIL